MKLKYKIIIAVIIVVICQVFGAINTFKYRDAEKNVAKYSGRVVNTGDVYVDAITDFNSLSGEEVTIRIEKTKNDKFEVGDTIGFNKENDRYYYAKTRGEIKRIESNTIFLSVGSTFAIVFYFIYSFIYGKSSNKFLKRLPIIISIAFIAGMYIASFASQSIVLNVITIILFLSPFIVPIIVGIFFKDGLN